MKTTMTRRWMRLAAVACTFAVASSLPAERQVTLDLDIGSSDTTWQKYVRAPSSRTVAPASLLSEYSLGNVSNGDALVNGSTGPTILTRLTSEEDVPTIVLDFGQNVAGLLSISFAGSYSAGDGLPGITLAFSETLQYLTDISDFTRSDNADGSEKLTAGTDQIAVKDLPYTWIDQLGCENGTQVCADGLHGFRYVKICLDALSADAPYTSSLGSVSIDSVSLIYSGYLGTVDTFTGHFECSDAQITQWWYDAVYTNDQCTDIFLANDTEPRNAASPSLIGKLVLLDGAKRDRDPYVGDLAVAALTTYLSHDAPEGARNVLEDLAQHQTNDGWIPPASINNYTLPLFDYPLWWVVCSADHVMYTGNTTYLETYYPNMVKVLDDYYVSQTNSETSLIERPDGSGDYAFISRTGPVTYYNALYVHALTKAALLADVLGEQDDASEWRSRAAEVGPALISRNFDNSTGAFFDGGSCSDADICPTHAQDGNSLAILSGVVSNSTMAESILSYLNETTAQPYGNAFYDNDLVGSGYSTRVYAFISYFEIAARFMASPDTAQGALEVLRRLYGWMSSHDPFLTFWEGIGAGGVPYEAGFTSMAHGWSSGIVPLAINYILGVTPTAPGFQEWTLKPVLDSIDITWANGLVPTPEGGIWVQWQKYSTGVSLLVTSPDTTNGTAILPLALGDTGSVLLDGVTVYSQDTGDLGYGAIYQDGLVEVPLGGGSHVVTVK